MRITVVGAGKTGAHLAGKLDADNDVTVIDQRADRIELIRGMLPNVVAVLGDACDPDLLSHAGIEEADRVVAVTGDDEDNLVVAMLAKHFGVDTVYARVNHPDNEWLFDKSWGVDVAVSSSEVLYGLVEKDLRVGDLITLLDLDRDGISIEELTLPPSATAAGCSLAEIPLPPTASVVAVMSAEGATHIARGDTVLSAGDQLLLLVEEGTDKEGIRNALGVPMVAEVQQDEPHSATEGRS